MTLLEAVAVALGSGAVVTDLRWRTVPNALNLAGIVAGLGLALRDGGGAGMLAAAGGAALGFALFAAFYRLGGLGGGDVKLMAAFGSLLGPAGIFSAALLAAMAGALVALAYAAIRPRAAAIPYAPAIVVGAWLALWGRR